MISFWWILFHLVAGFFPIEFLWDKFLKVFKRDVMAFDIRMLPWRHWLTNQPDWMPKLSQNSQNFH